MYQNHMEVLIKHRSLYLTSRISDSGVAEWGQVICISNKFPGDADVVGPSVREFKPSPEEFIQK